MIRQPTESTLTDTHFPYATLFRSGREKQSLIVRYSFQGPISGHSLSAIRPDFWAKARYGEYEYGSRHAPWRGRGGRPDELVRRSSPSPPPPACRPDCQGIHPAREYRWRCQAPCHRSEEHTSELQSLMRISYAVFCLKKKRKQESVNCHTAQRT